MHWALGCAFHSQDMFMNFKYKKLKFNCELCKSIINDNHRDLLVIKIFKACYKLVILDVIKNNTTFWLPLTGSKKANIHMRRVSGDDFKKARMNGKWKTVDFLKSYFSGYQMSLYMLGNRTPRTKNIYVNPELRDLIAKNTNEGMSYGDNNNDRFVKDYYEQIYEMFPTVPKTDINYILSFGWKSLYLHNSYGGDTIIIDKQFWSYIGNLRKDSLKHFEYYKKKLITKIKVLYKRKKVPWDGYYYFALTEDQYQNYLSQKNSKGRPKKYFKFGNVFIYQILDECKIDQSGKKYIFRIPYISKLKLKYYVKDLKTDKAELIITREPLKFKDILVYNNEYETI